MRAGDRISHAVHGLGTVLDDAGGDISPGTHVAVHLDCGHSNEGKMDVLPANELRPVIFEDDYTAG